MCFNISLIKLILKFAAQVKLSWNTVSDSEVVLQNSSGTE